MSDVVFATKPIWIRGDSFIGCRFRIDFSMINTELRRSIFRSPFMLSFSASWGIPRRSTASPAFRPKSHPRTELIDTWVVHTRAFFILVLSKLTSASMSHANHDSICYIVSFFTCWLLFVCFRNSCWMLMHTFVRLDFRLMLKLFLLCNTNFVRVSVLECKNNQFV